MATAPPLDNSVVIAGWVTGPSQTRYSPAGLPITRFLLEHHSRQVEVNIPREARCQIPVLACGEILAADARALAPGTLVRVRGFICRADHRQGEHRLVVHAAQIETLELL
jgi:primosomal replication protein N